jgi:hypothetical protein
MLAPAKVSPIGHTFDVVLAQTAEVMAARSKARARISDEVSKRVELRRTPRMREPSPAQGAVGQVAL